MISYPDFHTHRTDAPPGTAIVNLPPDAGRPDAAFCPTTGTLYSVGLHPWHIQPSNWQKQLEQIEALMRHPQVVAVGECGLDHLAAAPAYLQTEVFSRQAVWAERYAKPLIIPCVRAWDELLRLHRSLHPTQTWTVHGFRGRARQAEQLLRAGLSLSFGPRFDKDAVALCPLHRLRLETDEAPATELPALYAQVAHLHATNVEYLRRQQESLLPGTTACKGIP